MIMYNRNIESKVKNKVIIDDYCKSKGGHLDRPIPTPTTNYCLKTFASNDETNLQNGIEMSTTTQFSMYWFIKLENSVSKG